MNHDYILITPSASKPKGNKPSRKIRKPSPHSGGIIEIVDTASPSRTSPSKRLTKAKSSAQGISREISQDSLGSHGPQLAKEQSVSAVTRLHEAGGKGLPGEIDYGDTLDKCLIVDEVREWFLRQQASFNEKVAKGFGWRRLLDETRAKAEAILNGVGTIPAYTLSNDRLGLEAFERLRHHLTAYVSADPANEVALVTFISGDGGTSLDRPVIEVRKSRKLVNDTMRKMAPHWFGLTDLAFFWTIQHPDGGLHLQRHEHVVAWGPGFIGKAQGVATKQSARFTANVTNAPIIKVVRAWDASEVNLARLAAYLLKAPAKGKNWFEYPDGKQLMNHTEKKDRYIQFLRLAQIRSMLSLEDVILGGGDGIKIKGSMVDDMRGLAQADARGRAITPLDLIPTFWADFNQELGQHHWSLPAILRR